MIILGIESSCDETAAAIVNDKKQILSHTILSKDDHKVFGGVVPEIAARNHLDCLQELVRKTLIEANISFAQLSAVAATGGPGLIGGILVGTMFAKGLSLAINKPYIAVNHLEGHALTVRLSSEVDFPFLLLLVSGGHCQILEVLGVGRYRILGQTIDDALGEAFDKVAKMLGYDYPGGPKIEEAALKGNPGRFQLPRPLLRQSKVDFSFSGLKTAVKRIIDEKKVITEADKADLCASFQDTVAEILINRLLNSIQIYKRNNSNYTLVIAGGVAANKFLKSKIAERLKDEKFQIISPPLNLCTDNGVMIAWAGLERYKLGLIDELNFIPRSRWPLEELNSVIK